MSRYPLTVGAASAVLAAAALLAPPSAAATGEAESCVANLTEGSVECFDTRVEAEAEVSGTTAPASTPSRLSTTSSVTTAAAAAADLYTIGRVYEHSNFGGAVFIFVAETNCDSDPDIDKRRNSMPSGWNDEISSFTGHSRCQLKLWEHDNQVGDSYGQTGSASSVGSMNDRASSISFH